MVGPELINLVKDFQSNCPELEQITFYPDISQEMLEHVRERFPEFNSQVETPLLFYIDEAKCDNNDLSLKWIMLTDSSLYYYLYYFPKWFNALNFMPLHKIKSFEIMRNKWNRDIYVEINGKKIGSLEIKHKVEKKVLAQFVNLVLDYVKTTDKIVEEEPRENEYAGLENASLFTFARDYFDEVNRGGRIWAFECFHYGSFISEEKLEMARQDYANYDVDKEKPIIYYDNSWTGKYITFAKIDLSGVVITNKYFYYKLKKSIEDKKMSQGKILVSEIKTFQIKVRFYTWMIINRGRWKFMLTRFSIFEKEEAKIFEGLMRKFIEELNKQTDC